MSYWNNDNPYGNQDDNPWGGGGFNAEDYLGTIDETTQAAGGNLSDAIWESLGRDYDVSQQHWLDTQSAWQNYVEETQAYGGKMDDYWTEYERERDASIQKGKQAIAEFDKRVTDQGARFAETAQGFKDELTAISEAGTERAREYTTQATQKFEQLEADLKDYSLEEISGEVEGITAQMQNQTQQRVEEARRSGAPQSVIDNIQHAGNVQVNQTLQSGIAKSRRGWQQLKQEAGTRTAQSYQSGAQMEAQLTAQEAELSARGSTFAMEGERLKNEMEILGATVTKDYELTSQDRIQTDKQQRLLTNIEAEQFKIQGLKDWAEAIKSNPPVLQSSVYSQMLAMQTMPKFGIKGPVGEYTLPGYESTWERPYTGRQDAEQVNPSYRRLASYNRQA